jgi:hypothetical protein
MFVWTDGTVTGSVNVEELEKIQAAQKAAGKRKLAALAGRPVETVEQLAELLDAASEPEPEPEAVKATAPTKKKGS